MSYLYLSLCLIFSVFLSYMFYLDSDDNPNYRYLAVWQIVFSLFGAFTPIINAFLVTIYVWQGLCKVKDLVLEANFFIKIGDLFNKFITFEIIKPKRDPYADGD